MLHGAWRVHTRLRFPFTIHTQSEHASVSFGSPDLSAALIHIQWLVSCYVVLNLFTHKYSDLLVISLSLQRLYSPGWASASFKSFLHPSRFRESIFQFLHPSLAMSSSTPSSQHSLGLPLGHFPPGSLRRTLLDKSSSS